eukprot:3363029-Amphidinium_carterae.1
MAAAPFAVAGITVSVCDRLARGCTWCCSAIPVVGSGCTVVAAPIAQSRCRFAVSGSLGSGRVL